MPSNSNFKKNNLFLLIFFSSLFFSFFFFAYIISKNALMLSGIMKKLQVLFSHLVHFFFFFCFFFKSWNQNVYWILDRTWTYRPPFSILATHIFFSAIFKIISWIKSLLCFKKRLKITDVSVSKKKKETKIYVR